MENSNNMKLSRRKLFNPDGDDSMENRKILGGNPTGIANLNSVKYKWTSDLHRIMLGNFWIPEKVSLVEDRASLKQLDPRELEALKATLSFLIALDSLQTSNIPNLANYIGAPEVSSILVTQAFQENIHQMSYQYLLLELFPSIDREEIYNLWRNNSLLLKRNKLVADVLEKFNNEQTEDNFKRLIAADIALEGIFFFTGFLFFYLLASRQRLVQSARMIRYINVDEETHLALWTNIAKEVMDFTNEHDRQIMISTLTEAAEQEIEWATEIYGDHILGISKQALEEYVKYLTNQRAKLFKLGTIYPGYNKNPFSYIDAKERASFFESKVTEYSQSASLNWGDF